VKKLLDDKLILWVEGKKDVGTRAWKGGVEKTKKGKREKKKLDLEH